MDLSALADAHQFEETAGQLEHVLEEARRTCHCHADSGAQPAELLSEASNLLRTLLSSYHSTTARMKAHLDSVRAQRDKQAEEFVRARVQLDEQSRVASREQNEELSRIRIEEMLAHERQTAELRQRQQVQEGQWLKERLQVEEKAEAEVARLKKEAESVAERMATLSSNSQALMEGEQKAIETGEGPLKRIVLLPSDSYGGHTSEEFHFRLAESQFLRLRGGFHVTKVEYIIQPPLLKRYHDFKKALAAKGEKVEERLTFHGTTEAAIEKIVQEGFRIGGIGLTREHTQQSKARH